MGTYEEIVRNERLAVNAANVAIDEALEELENISSDAKLFDAIVLLGKAKRLVSEHLASKSSVTKRATITLLKDFARVCEYETQTGKDCFNALDYIKSANDNASPYDMILVDHGRLVFIPISDTKTFVMIRSVSGSLYDGFSLVSADGTVKDLTVESGK